MRHARLLALPALGIAMVMASASAPAFAAQHAGAPASASVCGGFKWDIADVVALFSTQAEVVKAGTDPATTPIAAASRLLALDLPVQDAVQFAAPVGKVMLADGAHAGMLRFTPPASGAWLVALDQGAWIDVVADGKRVESVDFSGSEACRAPRKTVLYHLQAGVPYVVQFSAVEGPRMQVVIAPGPSAAK